MTIRSTLLPLLCVVATLASGAALAAPDCRAVPRLTPIEQRIADTAARGTDELRRHVQAVRHIHQFHLIDTMESAMRHHQWQSACGRAVAGNRTSPEPEPKPTQ